MSSETMVRFRREIIDGLKGRVNENSIVTLYACFAGFQAGVEEGFIQSVADVFNLPAAGFTNPLQGCVNQDDKRTRILKRGFLRKGETPMKQARNCIEAGFSQDVRDLKPDTIVPPNRTP
jgi:hypothetical protein